MVDEWVVSMAVLLVEQWGVHLVALKAGLLVDGKVGWSVALSETQEDGQ